MIELIAYGQTPQATNDSVGASYVLDLSNPGAISITYQVGKGEEIMGRYSPFSQTFRLPFSNINSEFFGHYYDINIDPQAVNNAEVPKFDIHRKAICEIRMDGVPVIQGSLQLKSVSIKEEEFEVVVFGAEANLFQDIHEKKLIDLFINDAGVQNIDYDVILTDSNIINSFNLANDVTEGLIGAGIIIVPIMDYGHNQPYGTLTYESSDTGTSGIAIEHILQPCMLKPCINVSHVFKEIINQGGYTLSETGFILSDAWTKLFMTLGDNMTSVATRGILGVCVAKPDTEILHTFSAGTTELFILPFNGESGAGYNNAPPLLYDEGDNWNPTTHTFTAPADGFYSGEFQTSIDVYLQDIDANYKLYVIGANPDHPLNWSGMDMTSPTFTGSVTYQTLIWHCFLEEGEQLQCGILVWSSAGTGTLKLNSMGTFFKITSSTLINGVASIPDNMPDVLQTDFVKDMCERFNLCVVSNPDNPKLLTIQPWQEYIDLGTHKDWTEKLDLSQKRTITPTDKIRKKFIEFRDLEDPTSHNRYFQDVNGYPIGKYSQEIGSDFVQGTLKNSPLFAPFQVSPIPISGGWQSDAPDFLIANQTQGEGPIADAQPKLFYHNGLKTLDNGATFFVGSLSSTSYPLCLNFYNAGSPIELDSPLLLWSFENQAASWNSLIGWTPSNQTYFARYYQRFLLSIYSEDARLFECSMVLTPADIFNFRFNDEIQIENTPFRVLKISNYQPSSDTPCKVQLLKKIERVSSLVLPDPDTGCDLNLTGYLANGNAVFTDPTTGVTSSGTEECCNEHHFFWNGTDCLWNQGQGGGGNPGDPNVQDFEPKNYLTGKSGFNSVKTIRALNFNPIQGEFSTSGMNNSSEAPSTAKDFVFYCTTLGSIVNTATLNGVDTQNGTFSLAEGMMCRFVLRALSIQTDNRAASTGVYGSTSFKVWTFIAKNLGGTITTSGSEQTDFAEGDADIGVRTVSLNTVKGIGGNANRESGVAIQCTGPADTIVSWHLDCSATFVDLTSSSLETNLILLENLNKIMTENSNFLEQE